MVKAVLLVPLGRGSGVATVHRDAEGRTSTTRIWERIGNGTTQRYFADAKRVEVAEDPHQVYGRLNENAGLPVRFDAHYGSKTNVVYVNRARSPTSRRPQRSRAASVPFVEHG